MKLHEIAANAQHTTINKVLDNLNIKNYTIQPDGTVDVNGNVDLGDVDLREFSGTIFPVKFGKVSGGFYCSGTNITSLDGAPTSVGGNFYCSYTNITSLDGAPTSVGGNFDCNDTRITSLDGAPNSVGGDFNCSYTYITSLDGAPTSVGGDFNCSHTNITSLIGAPKAVGGGFYCSGTKIRSVLRFLQIRGVNHIAYDSGPIDEILNKYVGTGDVISCQDELIDAGFKEQAKL